MVIQIHGKSRGNTLKLIAALGLFLVASLLFTHHSVYAANPATINFQGKVANPDGTNVNSGTNSYTVVFRLYQNVNPASYNPNTLSCAADANCYWEETDTVSVTNGVFQVSLGATCAFTSACNSGHSGIDFNSQNALSLTMKFNGDANGYMAPLMSMQSVPYALNSDKLGGIAASGFGQLATTNTWTNTNTIHPTTNVSSLLVDQTSAASPNADIFDVQGTNGSTNFLQITSTGANTATVALNSSGALTFTGAANSVWDLGAAHTLSLQTGNNGPITTGSGLLTAGGALTVTGLLTDNGGVTVNSATASGLSVTSGASVPTADQVSVSNTGSTGVVTAGANGLQINYNGGAAAVEAAGAEIDLQPGTTSGGTWSAVRIIPNATGAVTGVTENGVKLDNLTTPGLGTENAINVGTGWDNVLKAANITITQAGAVTAVGVNSGAGLLQGALGLTITGAASSLSGGAASINASSNFDTSINTGNSSGNVHIGDGTGSGTIAIGNSTSGGAVTIKSSAATAINLNPGTGGAVVKGGSNSTTAFQIQNAGGTSVFNLDTVGNITGNLITTITASGTPSFEGASTTGWTGDGGTPCTLTSVTSGTTVPYSGLSSGQCAASSTGHGFKYATGTNLANGAVYTLDFYAKVSATQGTVLNFGYAASGTEDVAGNSLTSQFVTNSGWTHYSITFKGTANAADFIYIKQNDATTRSLWIDGVTLQTDTNAVNTYSEGTVQLSGPITSSLILQNAANSTTALQVENAYGGAVLTVDTTDTNLIGNSGAEVSLAGWAGKGATPGTVTRDTSQQNFGYASFKLTGTAANDGAAYTFGTSLPVGTYSVGVSVRIIGNAFPANTLVFGLTNGGGDNNCTAIAPAVTATVPGNGGWTRFQSLSCTIASTAATAFYVKQTDATSHTGANAYWIDGVELDSGASLTPHALGGISLNGVINSPVTFQSKSNSTNAFQVNNAAGTNIFNIDSLNNGIAIAADTTISSQLTLRFATGGAGTNYVAFKAPAVIASNVTWTLPAADSAGCFKSDGAGNVTLATCGDIKTETITATGACTWTKAAGAILVMVDAIGGGGGGGGGGSNTGAVVRTGGSGGGGGAHSRAQYNATDLGGTENCSVGIGGTSGTAGLSGAVGGDGGLGGNTTFGTTTRLFAGGGGGGRQGVISAVAGSGGSGGGTGAIGVTGTAAIVAGGGPGLVTAGTANTSSTGGTGMGTSITTTIPGAEWGGAAGGGHTAVVANFAGGTSLYGGGGGGVGGGTTNVPALINATAGGNTNTFSLVGGGGGGAGTSGAVPTVGTPGTAGNSSVSGTGGGGGGSTITANIAGAAGGAGGAVGGGGGGAGSGSNTGGGGLGGAGGRGEIRVWTIKGTGADLAEIYSTSDSSIGPGDVVSLDPDLKAGVRKSTKAYDPTAFGIISTSPSLVTGSLEDEGATPVMVALAGRVPVKVNLENGPIKPGDFLTPSSTPGVAMRATKAGQIIGQAMIGFDSTQGSDVSKPGLIVAFVKNQIGNGSKLSDLVTGTSTIDDGSPVPDLSKLALAQLVTQKDQLSSSVNLSEITTDRVTAGLEVITPSVITDAITTNTIGSSGGGDISFLLNGTNRVVIKGKDGGENFSVDSSGNTQFGLNLVALGDIEGKGGLRIDGDALFNGQSTFAKLAQFLGDVNVQGRVTFNKDAGGVAVISKGGTRVDVTFDKEYAKPPVIGITLIADQTILPDGTVEDSTLKEQRLFNAGYIYLVSNSSTKGFTIVLNKKAAENLQFNWTSTAIQDAATTTGQPDPITDSQPAPTDSQTIPAGVQ